MQDNSALIGAARARALWGALRTIVHAIHHAHDVGPIETLDHANDASLLYVETAHRSCPIARIFHALV
jgi:hypothetical protein